MESLEEINQYTRDSYNKAAHKYYELFCNELDEKEFDRNILDEYLGLLNPGSAICSAGCGPCGHVEEYMSQKGFRITGIDISEKCIEIAVKNHPGLRFETMDFMKMNFEDDYFDGLVAYYSIIDMPKKYLPQIFNEFNRVLKQSGYLLIVVKEGFTEGYEKELLGIEAKIYFSLFTEEEVNTYLQAGGFEIITVKKRVPYKNEIAVNRIFAIGKK